LRNERAEGCGRSSGPSSFHAPDAPRRFAPDRPFAVLSIALDLAIDPISRRVEGSATHRLAAVSEKVDVALLDAVALKIESCLVDGERAAFSYDGETLVVRLKRPLARGAETTLVVAYSGSPERGVWFVGKDARRPDFEPQAWTQGQDEDARFWFPCFDHPHHKAPVEFRLAVPKGFVAISNGRLEERDDSGDKTVFRFVQEAPHASYLVSAVVGRFDVVEDRSRAVPLAYYVPPGRAADAARTFGRTPEMLELFSNLFGVPYAFEKYDQAVVADFIFGGMENTSATTLHEYVLLDATVDDAVDSDALIAHELAHQWFGDLVTCRHWSHAWLNEGFATYAEALWYERGRDFEYGRKHLLDLARSYFDEARERYARPIVCDKYEAPTDLFDRHLYEKGACVLHHLRLDVGDAAFFRAIARYLEAHRDGLVETIDLRRAFEAETGRSLEGFFATFVDSPGHPRFRVRHRYDPARRRLSLDVRQTVAEGATPYIGRVRCRAFFDEGDEVREFEVASRSQRFEWDLRADPVGARFASDGAPLFEIDFDRPEGFLIAQLERDGDLFGRVEAARALAASRTKGAVDALIAAFGAERRWTHRVELAAALGSAKTPAARDALAAAVGDPSPRVRAAVVEALGSFRDDAAARALAAAIETETGPIVLAEALRALGRTRRPEALEILRARAATRGSWNDVVRRGALDGAAALKNEDAAAFVRAELAEDRPDLVRAAACRALGAVFSESERKDAARRDLEAALDGGFHVARGAMTGLRSLGDPRATAALGAFARRRFEDGRLKRMARDVARDLRDGAPEKERASALRERLDRAEEKLRDLEASVDSLKPVDAEKSPRPAAAPRSRKKGRRRTKKAPPATKRPKTAPRAKRGSKRRS
jgi:aminopeptidase N